MLKMFLSLYKKVFIFIEKISHVFLTIVIYVVCMSVLVEEKEKEEESGKCIIDDGALFWIVPICFSSLFSFPSQYIHQNNSIYRVDTILFVPMNHKERRIRSSIFLVSSFPFWYKATIIIIRQQQQRAYISQKHCIHHRLALSFSRYYLDRHTDKAKKELQEIERQR